MLTILGSIAEFEREIMLERQKEGIAKAHSEGKYRGRAPTARAKADQVFALDRAGKTREAIAKEGGDQPRKRLSHLADSQRCRESAAIAAATRLSGENCGSAARARATNSRMAPYCSGSSASRLHSVGTASGGTR